MPVSHEATDCWVEDIGLERSDITIGVNCGKGWGSLVPLLFFCSWFLLANLWPVNSPGLTVLVSFAGSRVEESQNPGLPETLQALDAVGS
ncbi:hypothetical protein CYB_0658 [Synechococcus sp. JA-2-3B'a(2-13)]|nr:hypothetical protein CYB_0658 [Synechococcus sp. JA-2-3B'a(2-13)]